MGSDLDQLILAAAQAQLFAVLQAAHPAGLGVHTVEMVVVVMVTAVGGGAVDDGLGIDRELVWGKSRVRLS